MSSSTTAQHELERDRRRMYDGNGLASMGSPCDPQTGNITQCAQSIYSSVKLNGVPGKTYAYNSYHLQLAAAVAVAASGKDIQSIVKTFFNSYGMTESSYPGKCPEFAGGLITTGADYELFLRGVLAYDPTKKIVDESEKDATPFLTGYLYMGTTPLATLLNVLTDCHLRRNAPKQMSTWILELLDSFP